MANKYFKRPDFFKNNTLTDYNETHPNSLAGLILLKKNYYWKDPTIAQWQQWVVSRRKFLLWWEQRFGEITCYYCGRWDLKIKGKNGKSQNNVVTVDHKTERRHGGGDEFNNLVPACRSCNIKRDNMGMTPAEFYKYKTKKRNERIRDRKKKTNAVWWNRRLVEFLKEIRRVSHNILTDIINKLDKMADGSDKNS